MAPRQNERGWDGGGREREREREREIERERETERERVRGQDTSFHTRKQSGKKGKWPHLRSEEGGRKRL